MRAPILCVLLATLGAAACQVTSTPVARKETPQPVVAAASTEPSAANPESTTNPPKAASGLLKRPAGDVRQVSGVVQLEANYAVGRGGATLISDHGGGVLRLGDATLVANNGSNVISNNGGAIFSTYGNGIVSNNSGSIIGNNGGSLTSKVKYRLEAVADSLPDYGTVLPAAGVAVAIQNLATGQLLTLGQDAGGRSANVIITDAGGGFQAYLPATTSGSIRVLSAAQSGADSRLGTALLTSQLAQQFQLDEDSAQIASDARLILVSNFYRGFDPNTSGAALTSSLFGPSDPQTAADLLSGIQQLRVVYAKYGVATMSQARKLAIAGRMADVVIARTNLEQIPTLDHLPVGFNVPGLPSPAAGAQPTALAALSTVMRAVRGTVGKVMQRELAVGVDPATYFAAKPYILDANARDNTTYTILKPSDFMDFLVRGVVADPNLSGLAPTVTMLAVFADPDISGSKSNLDLFVRAEFNLLLQLTKSAFSGPDPALPEIMDAVEQSIAATATP